MNKMTQEELDNIVKQHQHWCNEDCEGWEGMKANLRGANLYGADLYGAYLSRAEKHRLGLILTKPMMGYKKTKEGVVITAEIPVGAIVFCNMQIIGLFSYCDKASDVEVKDGIKVRKWEDTEWHEPTVDYLFGGEP